MNTLGSSRHLTLTLEIFQRHIENVELFPTEEVTEACHEADGDLVAQ